MTNSTLLRYAQKYVDKLEKLIQQGKALYEFFMENEEDIILQQLQGINNYDEDKAFMTSKLDENQAALCKWQLQCCTILEQLPIKGTIYEHIISSMLESDNKKVKGVEIQELTIALEALKEDYQEGFLDSLMLQAEGEVLSDYLLQAKQFFDDKYYVAAVLIASSTLECAIKKACEAKFGQEISGLSKKKLVEISNIAKGKGLIDRRTSEEIKKIADLRNKAAHGDFETFNPELEEIKETVRELILKIEVYIEKYMR